MVEFDLNALKIVNDSIWFLLLSMHVLCVFKVSLLEDLEEFDDYLILIAL